MKTRKRNLVAYLVGALMLLAVPALAQDSAKSPAGEKPGATSAGAQKSGESKTPQVPAKQAEAPAKQEKTPAQKTARASVGAGGLQVVEAKAAGGVTDREAVDESSSFSAGDQVTIWAAIRNTESPGDIKMVWFANDKEVATIDIEVGQSWRWRTWSKSKVWAGDWKVEIQDGSGTVLETVEFSVSAA